MDGSIGAIVRLNDWRVWVNHRLLAAAEGLSAEQLERRFEIGQGSLRSTLAHMQAAEEIWLARVSRHENRQLVDVPERGTLEDLSRAWEASDEGWRACIGGLRPRDLSQVLKGQSSRGVPFRMPVMDCLLQVFTHSAYTAAQANNMLRLLGAKPVDLSLAAMGREPLAEGAAR